MKTKENRTNIFILALIIIGIATRFFLNVPNFTAIGAIALLSGAYFTNKKIAFLLPLAILFVSDIFIGFHQTMPFVYLPFMLIILIGFTLRNNKKPAYVIGASLLSSIIFFIISNFGVWVTGMGYTNSLIGVFIDGIPFFKYTIAGDLVFNAIFFASSYLVFRKTSYITAVNE